MNIAGPNTNELSSYEVAPFDEARGHYDADNLTDNLIPDDVFVTRERASHSAELIYPERDDNNAFLVATK